MGEPTNATLGLGSNLGSREAHLLAAEAWIAADPATEIVARSRRYFTDPIGPAQPRYVNAALAIVTERSPDELLDRLLDLERGFGRTREVRWGPRTVDLDLLQFEGVRLETARLTLPHPRLMERAFVLAPLLEVRTDHPDHPEIRAALERLGGAPPRLPPSEIVRRPDGSVVAHAVDDADALALGITALLEPRPGSASELRSVRGADVGAFVDAVLRVGRPGWVTIHAMGPPLSGTVVLGHDTAHRATGGRSLEVTLAAGTATLRAG